MKKIVIIIIGAFMSSIAADAQWQQMQRDTALFGNLYTSIHFVSDSVGFLVGCTGASSWDGIGLFKTKNAGKSWTTIHGTGGSDDCSIPNSFANENSGYCILTYGTMQQNNLAKTTDGGTTWNNLAQSSGLNPGNQSFTGAIYFANDTLGFVAKDDSIYKTTNGGSSWQLVNTGHPAKVIYFVDTQTGYAGGNTGILKTTDGGNNWQVIVTGYSIASLSFPSANIGYAVGANNTIIKTTDAGNIWKPQPSGLSNSISLNSIAAINDNTCYIVGDNGIILHTSDGGNNWVKENSGVTAKLNSISCTKKHCYVAGDTSVILQTTLDGLRVEPLRISGNKVNISPNPFSKEGKIITGGAVVTRITIYNAAGQKFEIDYSNSGKVTTIQRGNLPAGIYFIHLAFDDATAVIGKVVLID